MENPSPTMDLAANCRGMSLLEIFRDAFSPGGSAVAPPTLSCGTTHTQLWC